MELVDLAMVKIAAAFCDEGLLEGFLSWSKDQGVSVNFSVLDPRTVEKCKKKNYDSIEVFKIKIIEQRLMLGLCCNFFMVSQHPLCDQKCVNV